MKGFQQCSEKTILIKFFQFVVEQKNKNVKFESTVNFSLSAFNIRELVAEYRSSKPFASDEDIVADINKKYLAISQGTGLSELDKLIVVEGEKLSLSKQSLGEFVKNTYENGFSYPEDTYIIVIRRVCDTCDHLKNASLTLINALENYSQSNSRAVEIDDSDNLLTGYSDYIDTLHVCEPFLETNEEIDTHASSSSACRFGGTLHVS